MENISWNFPQVCSFLFYNSMLRAEQNKSFQQKRGEAARKQYF
jgi:hypothetical protein